MTSAGSRHLLVLRIACLAMGLAYLWLAGPGTAGEGPPVAAKPDKPLDLLLTREELRSINRRYAWLVPGAGEDDVEPVTVTAPAERLPMRDPVHDAWPGIAAPFWAVINPKEAWRIFVPIPPERGQE